MMGDAIRLSRRTISIKGNGALAHEVGCRFVFSEIVEDRPQVFSAIHFRRWCRRCNIHIDNEVRILCKQGHLRLRIASVGAACIRINEFTYRKTVGSFGA
jgi:hypothetical protein